MKKTYYICMTLALAAMTACQQGREELTPSEDLVEWTFEAPATKAGFDAAGKFSWEAGDRIALWDETSGAFVHFTTVTGSGLFYAKAPSDANFSGTAYYPTEIASVSGVVLSGEAHPLCAILEPGSNILHFKHIGAYLSLDVKNIPAEAVKLVVASESTAFRGTFPLTEGVWSADGTAGQVDFPVSGADMQLTLPVPVGSYTVSYRLENAGGEPLFTCSTDGDFSFERAHSYSFPVHNFNPAPSLSEITVELEDFEIDADGDYWE